jgi:hypothetical protein
MYTSIGSAAVVAGMLDEAYERRRDRRLLRN